MATGSLGDLEILSEILQEEGNFGRLSKWNGEMEALWAVPPNVTYEKPSWTPEQAATLSRKCGTFLLDRLCKVIGCVSPSNGNIGDVEETVDLAELANRVETMESIDLEELEAFLRTSKNWLRWHLQIYLPSVPYFPLPDPAHVWKKRATLNVFLELLERFCVIEPELARQAGQLCFYGSYCATSDQSSDGNIDGLLDDPKYYSRLLRCLMQSPTASLTLAIVKNLHHSLVSSPHAATHVNTTQLTTATTRATAPWVPSNMTTFLFRGALIEIMSWGLFAEPRFPGPKGDKRSELVIEVLRVLYTMRAGSNLDERFLEILRLLFQLSPDPAEVRSCQLAALPILMDTMPEPLSETVVASPLFMDRLLTILTEQVSKVLDNNQVDDAAAASLTPILAILLKCSGANPSFSGLVKDAVFPPSDEKHFQKLVEQETEKGKSTSTNMVPLDAPRGTLRWKLTQLMTWPQGHIKRFTGELMWTLSGGDAKYFVFRVGLGNALPILRQKGLAPDVTQNAFEL